MECIPNNHDRNTVVLLEKVVEQSARDLREYPGSLKRLLWLNPMVKY